MILQVRRFLECISRLSTLSCGLIAVEDLALIYNARLSVLVLRHILIEATMIHNPESPTRGPLFLSSNGGPWF